MSSDAVSVLLGAWLTASDALRVDEGYREEMVAEFERQIARVKAEAWDEGHAAGREYQADGWNADAHDPRNDNPYREVSRVMKLKEESK